MQRFGLFFGQAWYLTLAPWQRELVRTSIELYAREERMHSQFSDYSFLVFPFAKAYEGFLKDYLYSMGFISPTMHIDKRFRIGRALNPDINPVHRDESWVYGRLEKGCGRSTAQLLWTTWLECRNQVFHYFPHNERRLSLYEAGRHIEMLAQAIEQASRCRLEHLPATRNSHHIQ